MPSLSGESSGMQHSMKLTCRHIARSCIVQIEMLICSLPAMGTDRVTSILHYLHGPFDVAQLCGALPG